MAEAQAEAVRKGLAYGALGFGVLGAFAPKVFAAVYGVKGDGNLHTIIRLWGTRTFALGALTLKARDAAAVRELAILGVAMDAADAVFIATAGSDVALRSRILGTGTSAAFAAAGGYLLANP